MERANKTYGFTIAVKELKETVPKAMERENYNMCHFWSNFEIARLDWFRSKPYNDFFDMMDRSGGFWMERVIISSVFHFHVAN